MAGTFSLKCRQIPVQGFDEIGLCIEVIENMGFFVRRRIAVWPEVFSANLLHKEALDRGTIVRSAVDPRFHLNIIKRVIFHINRISIDTCTLIDEHSRWLVSFADNVSKRIAKRGVHDTAFYSSLVIDWKFLACFAR